MIQMKSKRLMLLLLPPDSGSTLERVILVNSDMSGGTGLFSFVSKTYTNSTDDYVKMVDGTVGTRTSSGDGYAKDIFYSYEMDGDDLETTKVFDLSENPSSVKLDTVPAGDDDLYWVVTNGTNTQFRQQFICR